jgi:ABC-type antimicrobial peptide transport system permease subunit
MTYVVRTAGDPSSYGNAIREVVRQADPKVPVANLQTQEAQIDQAIHGEIAFARLCTALGLLALAITCVGLFGTVSYDVARRTSEIGIRIALGARRWSVVAGSLREVVVLAAVGLAISVPAALVGSRLVESFLFGMKGNDPSTVGMAVLTLLAAALAAGALPAWRASRIDPMTALRHE